MRLPQRQGPSPSFVAQIQPLPQIQPGLGEWCCRGRPGPWPVKEGTLKRGLGGGCHIPSKDAVRNAQRSQRPAPLPWCGHCIMGDYLGWSIMQLHLHPMFRWAGSILYLKTVVCCFKSLEASFHPSPFLGTSFLPCLSPGREQNDLTGVAHCPCPLCGWAWIMPASPGC